MRQTLPFAAAFVALAAGSCSDSDRVTPPPAPIAQPTPTPTPTPTPVPTPDPQATPASCPTLTRWSSGIHNITDNLSRPVSTPYVGGHVLVDSTPLFGGQACNAERDNCGGRLCEPPGGGEWWLLEGGSPSQVRGDGYQFRIGPLNGGYHRWRVCPKTGTRDPQGVPLDVRENSCTEGLFFVYPAPVE
ncbi:MAG TPA: hypothetical protein VFO85_04130 [Vicinamibacteria bacterium]|nr:hypothetical protein [Vicinamibacteria bacterium]